METGRAGPIVLVLLLAAGACRDATVTRRPDPASGEDVVFRAPPAEPVLVRTEGLRPRFEDYPAGETFRGKPARVDLASHPEGRRRAELLRLAAARGPDFAGHYAIAQWREEGRSGPSFLIVDVATGRIHDGMEDATALTYRLDSSLIHFAAPEPAPGAVRCAGCIESFAVWTGGRLVQIPAELWVGSAPPAASVRPIVEQTRAEEGPAVVSSFAPRVLRPAWNRLVVTAESGTRRVFVDEVLGEEVRWIHLFRGSPPGIDGYVVERRYYLEGRQMYLVDGRTGGLLEIDELPVSSPAGSRFITASLDLVAGHLPNRIRIYRVQPGGPVLEWEIEPRDWGGQHPQWVDERTVRIERGTVDWSTHRLVTTPVLLRLQGGTWIVEPS